MKLDLVNNINDRNEVMKEENESKLLDILRKLGTVVDYMTEPMVAEFFEVNDSAIMNIGNRNKEELSNYGYRVYKKSEILNNQFDCLENISIPNRGLRLYPIKSVLVIGMMLTESKVAEQLRSEIIKELFSVKKQTTEDELVLALYHSESPIKNVQIARQLVELKLQEATKPLIEKIEIDKPKVDVFEKFLNSNGTYTSEQVAKLFGISSARKLNQILNEKGFIFKRGKNWLPYSSVTDKGWFKEIFGCTDEGYNYSQLRITSKGVIELSKILEIKINEKDLEDLVDKR